MAGACFKQVQISLPIFLSIFEQNSFIFYVLCGLALLRLRLQPDLLFKMASAELQSLSQR
jgi:hypothetical protein